MFCYIFKKMNFTLALCLLLFLLAVIFSVVLSKKDYDGYKVVEVTVSSEDDLALLKRLEKKYPEVNEWKVSKNPGDQASFAVPPGENGFCEDLMERQLECKVICDNLKVDIEAERSSVMFKSRLSSHGFDLFTYNRHPQINQYLEELVSKCRGKGLKCKVITIGQSYEGRDMNVIKIGSGGRRKPVIWIDAGIHAREWVAPSTAIIIANRLIYTYETDPETAEVLDAFDWYILPSANPDGYEYSWDEDRLWRKTTSHYDSPCHGTDPNRNWDFHWAESGTAPDDPCSDIYPGPYAFSEVEVVNIANFLEENNIMFYLSIHAYSQLWLTPWAYTDRIVPDNYDRLLQLGRAASDKINSLYNRKFDVGSASRILYEASGSSMDWTMSKGIKYSLAAELRDRGDHGFILPVSQVKPVGRETWLGIREMVKLVKQWELD